MKLTKVTKAQAFAVLNQMIDFAKSYFTDDGGQLLQVSIPMNGVDMTIRVRYRKLTIVANNKVDAKEGFCRYIVEEDKLDKTIPAKTLVFWVSQLIEYWSFIRTSLDDQAWVLDGREVFDKFRTR